MAKTTEVSSESEEHNSNAKKADDSDSQLDNQSQSSEEASVQAGIDDATLKAHAIAEKETRALFFSRVAVGILLAVTAGVAGVATYLVTSKTQDHTFDRQVSSVCN